MHDRVYSKPDAIIMSLDQAVRTLFGKPIATERKNPANEFSEAPLSDAEKKLSGRLMRINHAGEVSAQGLYQGQGLTAKLNEVKGKMQRAALEENDHLIWCAGRIKDLGTHTSKLNPLWYFGSLTIGAIAGFIGDKWSLGFVVETEKQVVNHLSSHLQKISSNDEKTRAILEQMREDEHHHATTALHAGGVDLPLVVKRLMTYSARIMTRTTYWI